jgi:hypothetical protein
MNSLITSLVIVAIGFASIVPAGWLTLFLLACSKVTRGKHPIFLLKITTPSSSNLGRTVTHKNFILGMLLSEEPKVIILVRTQEHQSSSSGGKLKSNPIQKETNEYKKKTMIRETIEYEKGS